jgi:uncharacterized protein (DUF2141 family)
MRKLGFRLAATVGLLMCGLVAADAAGNSVGVVVTGLRNDNGVVRCGLFASADTFRQPGRQYRGVVAPVSGGQAVCSFGNLPPGTYAVAAFHAESNESQMQYGAFGKPKQGYGFSRNPSSGFGPPEFSAAAFDYRGGSQTMQVQLQY